MREIAIGDVHGRFPEFESLMAALEERYRPGGVFVILVGDLVDRGPRSAAVVAAVRRIVETGRGACVLGNHDEMMLQAVLLHRADLVEAAGLDPSQMESLVGEFRFAPQQVLRHWVSQGGGETIRSYGGDPWRPASWEIPPEDVGFLARLPLAWAGSGMVVSHARAGEAALQEALAYRERPWAVSTAARHQLLWSRSAPADPPATFHVSGHTPREEPLRRERAIEIDTGCVFGNRLTAYDPEEDLLLQIPCS